MKRLLSLLPLFIALLSAHADVWDGQTIDTSWYKADQTEFHLYTAAQLSGLEQLVNKDTIDFYGCSIFLEDDINLGNHQWNPIGYGTNKYAGSLSGFRQGGNAFCFNGTFDGQGHSVSNICITTSEIGYFSSGVYHGIALGLFGVSDVGEIQNLDVRVNFTFNGMSANVYRIGEFYLGGVIGRGGNVRRCSSKAEINMYTNLDCSRYDVGFLAGKADEVVACSADGVLHHYNSSAFYDANSGEGYFGGLVGFANTVRQCSSAGDVGCTIQTFSNYVKVGGLCGFASLIEDCIFKGNISVMLRNASNNRSLVYGISPCERLSSSDATCVVRNVISAPESYWTDAIYAWQKGLVTKTNSDYITIENAYYLLEQATGNEKWTSVDRETLIAGVPLSGFKTSVWRFEAGKMPALKALAKTYRIGIPVEGGHMSLLVDEGETASFEITADKGWSLSALYVDYTDCTAYMQGNRYILTNVSRNHTVSAVFEQSPEVGIQTQKTAQQPRLVVNPDRSLAFENLTGKQWLHIYDISGKLLMQRHVDANSHITLEPGIYIVKAGNHTYKINL